MRKIESEWKKKVRVIEKQIERGSKIVIQGMKKE